MGWPVAGPKFDVRVDFRGVQIKVAHELLDVTQTSAATQQMRRARVTKVCAEAFTAVCKSVVADAIGNHLIGETTASD